MALAAVSRPPFYKRSNSRGSAIPAGASRRLGRGGSRAANRVMH